MRGEAASMGASPGSTCLVGGIVDRGATDLVREPLAYRARSSLVASFAKTGCRVEITFELLQLLWREIGSIDHVVGDAGPAHRGCDGALHGCRRDVVSSPRTRRSTSECDLNASRASEPITTMSMSSARSSRSSGSTRSTAIA